MRKHFDYKEWYSIIEPIISNPEFEKRKTFLHHGDESVYDHSIRVSKRAYMIAKELHDDYKSAAIAGILHDFYTTPWQDEKIRQPIYKMHAFTHAKVALDNSKKYFKPLLNPKIENAILRHMFPLNIVPPKFSTGYIVTLSDKICSMDMLKSFKSMRTTFMAPISQALFKSKEVLILCYLYVSYLYVL